MTRFLLFLALAAACRGADLLSTWLFTPDLKLERNPIIRRIGWRWAILLNLPLCVGVAWEHGWGFAFVCLASLILAFRNAWAMLKVFH